MCSLFGDSLESAHLGSLAMHISKQTWLRDSLLSLARFDILCKSRLRICLPPATRQKPRLSDHPLKLAGSSEHPGVTSWPVRNNSYDLRNWIMSHRNPQLHPRSLVTVEKPPGMMIFLSRWDIHIYLSSRWNIMIEKRVQKATSLDHVHFMCYYSSFRIACMTAIIEIVLRYIGLLFWLDWCISAVSVQYSHHEEYFINVWWTVNCDS